MIRMVLTTDVGPMILLGIVEENIRRLRSGQPMDVDLGKLLVESTRGHEEDPQASGTLRLVVVYGETHVEIIEEIGRVIPGGPPDYAMRSAVELDGQLRSEGRL